MVKSKLISLIASKLTTLPDKVVEQGVNQVLNSMSSVLSRKGRIELRDFGSFALRKRAARVARNPRTGDQIITPNKYAIHFRPGKKLASKLNQSKLAGTPIATDSK